MRRRWTKEVRSIGDGVRRRSSGVGRFANSGKEEAGATGLRDSDIAGAGVGCEVSETQSSEGDVRYPGEIAVDLDRGFRLGTKAT